jgi:hypothetical protein
MENQIIYWANLSQLPTINLSIKPLLPDIAKKQSAYRGENYVACPVIRSKHSNTFFSTIPYDIDIEISGNQFISSDAAITPRQGLYENSYAFNWNIERIFFSPSKQVMEVSPAFLHKTSYSQYGHAPSGSFDISSWFRPSSPTFQLWTGEKKFSAKEGEAHLYFNFPSENKIILQEFFMTDKLYEIMNWCLSYKTIKPNTPLKELYENFNFNNMNQLITEEIKENLSL